MSKTSKIIYWIATLWFALGMVSSGIVQLILMKEEVDMMTHLGYHVYFLTLLSVWKMLGVVAILIPKFTLLKEWAYAGFFFAMSGALMSHLVLGDTIKEIFPSILLFILTLLSCYYRPSDRKIVLLSK